MQRDDYEDDRGRPELIFFPMGVFNSSNNVFARSRLDNDEPSLAHVLKAERGGPEGTWRFKYDDFCMVRGRPATVATCSENDDQASFTIPPFT